MNSDDLINIEIKKRPIGQRLMIAEAICAVAVREVKDMKAKRNLVGASAKIREALNIIIEEEFAKDMNPPEVR